ncbi:MAG: hypothetical protein A3B10_03470 [Candidatus Doudnabacteria bacterium RIFCSPLOWO2_01_FULL_44_21]|uniref:Uncharacterized protein n=1 Tax=Candidatus Doudnabacteria bacterium RIFCSPLOWO2_01_FULL_44_21 TaxID=1817841 RepID=A0A1F5PY26_9BACT|nr:MAG: hypothetical protein A3B95_02380 [Candidatus Doudnabacteria bacterium RIFCSPHIGHO2_02_FULL_43_13b]OGE94825.1 MAG: hypothetical protein A3B10_03470 [Candidatus Doudnabacteria bacterium RIFCSPLOWO2_01_FULL_44_21]
MKVVKWGLIPDFKAQLLRPESDSQSCWPATNKNPTCLVGSSLLLVLLKLMHDMSQQLQYLGQY